MKHEDCEDLRATKPNSSAKTITLIWDKVVKLDRNATHHLSFKVNRLSD